MFTWFHTTSVNGGAMAIAATIATYFSLYVQNEIGITAAQLSVILLICSLWDAINDPVMGVICDSINPKAGRYRIWFTFTPVFLLVDMFLLFSNPGFIQGSTMAKCVYVCVTYMFYGMIVTAYEGTDEGRSRRIIVHCSSLAASSASAPAMEEAAPLDAACVCCTDLKHGRHPNQKKEERFLKKTRIKSIPPILGGGPGWGTACI